MYKCVVCGKYYDKDPNGMTLYNANLYCSNSCADEAYAEEDQAAAALKAAEDQAEAIREAAQEAQWAAEEAEANAAKRAAWPAFEEKYASLFEDDIPDWFVDLFSIDTIRGRYVPNNTQQMKEFKEILASNGGKADNFNDNYWWWYGQGRWISFRELYTERDAALKRLEDAMGIKFDPLGV